jgi:hypothetical protein
MSSMEDRAKCGIAGAGIKATSVWVYEGASTVDIRTEEPITLTSLMVLASAFHTESIDIEVHPANRLHKAHNEISIRGADFTDFQLPG